MASKGDTAKPSGWKDTVTGRGPSECHDGEGPAPLATLVFIVMLLGLAGRALTYGEDIQRLTFGEEREKDQLRYTGSVTAIVCAMIAQLLAVYYYYNRYSRCRPVQGFAVFAVVTAIFAFVLAAVVRPRPPPRPRFGCPLAAKPSAVAANPPPAS